MRTKSFEELTPSARRDLVQQYILHLANRLCDIRDACDSFDIVTDIDHKLTVLAEACEIIGCSW